MKESTAARRARTKYDLPFNTTVTFAVSKNCVNFYRDTKRNNMLTAVVVFPDFDYSTMQFMSVIRNPRDRVDSYKIRPEEIAGYKISVDKDWKFYVLGDMDKYVTAEDVNTVMRHYPIDVETERKNAEAFVGELSKYIKSQREYKEQKADEVLLPLAPDDTGANDGDKEHEKEIE